MKTSSYAVVFSLFSASSALAVYHDAAPTVAEILTDGIKLYEYTAPNEPNTYLGYLYGEQLFMCFYQEGGFGCVEQQVGDVTFLDDAGE